VIIVGSVIVGHMAAMAKSGQDPIILWFKWPKRGEAFWEWQVMLADA